MQVAYLDFSLLRRIRPVGHRICVQDSVTEVQSIDHFRLVRELYNSPAIRGIPSVAQYLVLTRSLNCYTSLISCCSLEEITSLDQMGCLGDDKRACKVRTGNDRGMIGAKRIWPHQEPFLHFKPHHVSSAFLRIPAQMVGEGRKKLDTEVQSGSQLSKWYLKVQTGQSTS